MPLTYVGRRSGFASNTFNYIKPTPFLDGLLDYDLAKWRSPVTQTLIEKDLHEFSNSTPIPDDPLLDLAIAHATRRFLLPTPVKMLHLLDVFKQDLDIWTKSPGLPWTSMGVRTKGSIRDNPQHVQAVRRFWHLVKLGQDIHFPDACAFVRSHTCKVGEYKVRAVWGYPATVTFGEAVFALPLIRAYQSLPENIRPIAYGYETYNGGAIKIRNRFARSYRATYVGMDFSKFDKTVPSWLVRKAFMVLEANVDFTHYEGYGVADARHNYTMWHRIREYFIKTTIRLASGRRFRKTSGIASGSYFTQLIGSICNCIVVYYTSLKLYGHLPLDDIYLGDDSFLLLKKFDVDEASDLILNTFGMKINTAKTEVSHRLSDLSFLGYVINSGLAKKDESDLFTALLFPERPDKTWDEVASRALGLYYANLGLNQNFASVAWKIVNIREFEITFGRNFQRMLKHLGIEIDNEVRLPAPIEFLRRLRMI